jgi:hypothetical protein
MPGERVQVRAAAADGVELDLGVAGHIPQTGGGLCQRRPARL